MKALVVGGNGFIGSHLVDELITRDWEVVVLDLYERRYGAVPKSVKFIRGDLSQLFLVREALTGVDVVFHLAWTTIHEIANQDLAADVHANLVPSIQLMEASRLAGVKKIIFTSSGGTVYGPAIQIPISETHPKNPINGYGVTKLAVEKYLHMFHHLYGLEHAIFRPSVPYGPRQNPLGRQGAVAVFLYRVAHGMPITIWGDGSVTRDYFYISDLVDAMVLGAEQQLDVERIFNIGGAKEVSLNELLAYVEKTVGEKASVEYLPPRKFDAPRVVLDTQVARRTLNWRPRVTLTEGLVETWDWMSKTIQ